MLIDHIHGNLFASFTLQRFSFMDTADVFVFLSGYVAGLVYTTLYLRAGWDACWSKAMHRCRQLYAAQMILLVGSSLVLAAFARHRAFIPDPDPNTYAFLQHPFRALAAAALFLHAPGLSGLLPLYVLFLAATPFAVVVLCKRPLALVGASALLYTAVQFSSPRFNFYFIYAWPRQWLFNPGAWQFLFVFGLLLGNCYVRGWRLSFRPGDKIVLLCAGGLILIAVTRCASSAVLGRLLHLDLLRRVPEYIPLTGKQRLEPLRLINLSLAATVFASLRRNARFWRSWIARALALLGSNSLLVYSTSVIVSYAGTVLVVMYGARPLLCAGLTGGGIGLLLIAASAGRLFHTEKGAWRRALPQVVPISLWQ